MPSSGEDFHVRTERFRSLRSHFADGVAAVRHGTRRSFRRFTDRLGTEEIRRAQRPVHERFAGAVSAGAAQAGYHVHVDAKTGKKTELDAELDDMSLKAMDEQRAFYVAWRERFRA